MSTALEIVQQAFREGNLVPLDATTGVPVITDGMTTEGLMLLNRFIDSLFGLELGEYAYDWPVPPSATSPVPARYPIFPKDEALAADVWPYPPGNVRIITLLTGNTTIYLPSSPDDGARVEFANVGGTTGFSLTVDGNGRLVNGTLTNTETDVLLDGTRMIYRADTGNWTPIATLIEGDSSPLPALYDDLLSIGTFIRIAPRYGRSITPELSETYARLLKRLKTQFRQTVQTPAASPQQFTGRQDINSSIYNGAA
tara:strand:- start:16735 stop:17499 length:765 start_codon:yes stop_codon:yes gene_type:complete